MKYFFAAGPNYTYDDVVTQICCLDLNHKPTGVYGEESSNAENAMNTGLLVSGIGCVVVLVVVIAVCIDKRVHTERMDKGPPFWAHNLEFKQEYSAGFTSVSDGMENLGPFHVVRRRIGVSVTDGARWDKGFVEGKHVFEVEWHGGKNRGMYSSIGVGTLDVPIKKQGRMSLVGHHSQSWGYDLSSRRMTNTNKIVGNFLRQFPPRFYMYLDMDSGKIGFGEDIKQYGGDALFYGYLINGMRVDRDKPLYPMVGSVKTGEEIKLFYVGTAVQSGGFDLCPPVQPVVVVQQQAAAQEILKETGKASPPPVVQQASD